MRCERFAIRGVCSVIHSLVDIRTPQYIKQLVIVYIQQLIDYTLSARIAAGCHLTRIHAVGCVRDVSKAELALLSPIRLHRFLLFAQWLVTVAFSWDWNRSYRWAVQYFVAVSTKPIGLKINQANGAELRRRLLGDDYTCKPQPFLANASRFSAKASPAERPVSQPLEFH